MRRKWIWLLAGWLMVTSLVGCGRAVSSLSVEATPTTPLKTPTSEAPAPTATVTQGPREETVAVSPTIPAPSNPTLQKLVAQAKEDLARRLSIKVEEIGLVEAKAVEWPDTSLGCPQPGMMYAQVITPGFRVVLEAEAKTYEYHTDQTRSILCAQGSLSGETSWVFPESGKLPIFVEVIQTYLLSGSTLETPLTDVPPNGVFAFNPNGQILLLLRPSITIFPETKVLIGQTTVIQSPNQTLVRGELFQVPLSDTGLIKVIAVDAETGALTLAYGDQTFELHPGQSRSFKQTGDQAATEITIVTNAGRLASIEPLPYGPDAR